MYAYTQADGSVIYIDSDLPLQNSIQVDSATEQKVRGAVKKSTDTSQVVDLNRRIAALEKANKPNPPQP